MTITSVMPGNNNIDATTMAPLSFDELRSLARAVAFQAGYGLDGPPDQVEDDLGNAMRVTESRGVSRLDEETLYLACIAGDVRVTRDGADLSVEEITTLLGDLGEQAYTVAITVTLLLAERGIAFSPVATDQEKEQARACRYAGFEVLPTDLWKALDYGRAVASVIYDIENRLVTT